MSSCKIDHTREDIKKKLMDQQSFLEKSIYTSCLSFLDHKPSQLQLNELFHLLKKFDLANITEQQDRLNKIKILVNNEAKPM